MLLQMIPCSVPLWAVFADDIGNPDVRPVACLGMIEVDPETQKRVVSAFAVGQHIEAVDFFEHFVSLATHPDPAPWLEKCQARRTAIAQAKRENKIFVPDTKVAGAF